MINILIMFLAIFPTMAFADDGGSYTTKNAFYRTEVTSDPSLNNWITSIKTYGPKGNTVLEMTFDYGRTDADLYTIPYGGGLHIHYKMTIEVKIFDANGTPQNSIIARGLTASGNGLLVPTGHFDLFPEISIGNEQGDVIVSQSGGKEGYLLTVFQENDDANFEYTFGFNGKDKLELKKASTETSYDKIYETSYVQQDHRTTDESAYTVTVKGDDGEKISRATYYDNGNIQSFTSFPKARQWYYDDSNDHGLTSIFDFDEKGIAKKAIFSARYGFKPARKNDVKQIEYFFNDGDGSWGRFYSILPSGMIEQQVYFNKSDKPRPADTKLHMITRARHESTVPEAITSQAEYLLVKLLTWSGTKMELTDAQRKLFKQYLPYAILYNPPAAEFATAILDATEPLVGVKMNISDDMVGQADQAVVKKTDDTNTPVAETGISATEKDEVKKLLLTLSNETLRLPSVVNRVKAYINAVQDTDPKAAKIAVEVLKNAGVGVSDIEVPTADFVSALANVTPFDEAGFRSNMIAGLKDKTIPVRFFQGNKRTLEAQTSDWLAAYTMELFVNALKSYFKDGKLRGFAFNQLNGQIQGLVQTNGVIDFLINKASVTPITKRRNIIFAVDTLMNVVTASKDLKMFPIWAGGNNKTITGKNIERLEPIVTELVSEQQANDHDYKYAIYPAESGKLSKESLENIQKFDFRAKGF